MDKFRVWCPTDGKGPETAVLFRAFSAAHAAERWAEVDEAQYAPRVNGIADVAVATDAEWVACRRWHHFVGRHFRVRREMRPCFVAEEVE